MSDEDEVEVDTEKTLSLLIEGGSRTVVGQ